MGLVAKSRRQNQIASLSKNTKLREETKKFGYTSKKICPNCEIETAGIFKDNKLRCHKCKTEL